MSRLLLIIGSWLLALAAITAAQADELSSNAAYFKSERGADALFQLIGTKPCCYNNGEYFYSTPKTCLRYGGRVVPYEACERQFGGGGYGGGYSGRPCCYNNGQYFNASARTCRRYGGRPVAQDYCNRYYDDQWGGDDGGYNEPNLEKPCCFNNGRYYNSTPKTCRKYGGQVVPQRYCLRQY